VQIYKIIDQKTWQQAVDLGTFSGAAIDLEDGYIHFSTKDQLKETAARHFAGQHGLLLVRVDSEQLGDALKWEPSRGGDLFPHLYESLDTSTVAEVVELPLKGDGSHQFPDLPE